MMSRALSVLSVVQQAILEMTVAQAAGSTSSPASAEAAHTMQCMEVWGGNQAADNGVVMPGLDVWVFSRPFENSAGGGDVHYVSSCGTGRITRLLVADVSGHGAKVSEVAVALRRLMRRYVNYIDQSRFVESVNREFATIASAGGFATCLAMTFFAPSNHLSVSNAGHPRPLLYRAREKRWHWLSVDDASSQQNQDILNLPLGIVEPTRYDQFGVRLSREDLVLLYTDSLTESRSREGRMLGEQGLMALVQQLDVSQPQQLVSDLLEKVAEFRGSAEADDDVTVLLLRHNGQRVRSPIGQRLWAQVRLIGLIIRGLLPGSEPVPWPELRWANIAGAILPAAGRSWGGKTRP